MMWVVTSGIKCIYINSQAYARVKVGESVCFTINSGVRQRFILTPSLFNVYIDAMMKENKE